MHISFNSDETVLLALPGCHMLDLKLNNKGIGSTMLIFGINKIKGHNFIIDQTLKPIYLTSLKI